MSHPVEIPMVNKDKIYLNEYVFLDFAKKKYRGREKFYIMNKPLVDVIKENEFI